MYMLYVYMYMYEGSGQWPNMHSLSLSSLSPSFSPPPPPPLPLSLSCLQHQSYDDDQEHTYQLHKPVSSRIQHRCHTGTNLHVQYIHVQHNSILLLSPFLRLSLLSFLSLMLVCYTHIFHVHVHVYIIYLYTNKCLGGWLVLMSQNLVHLMNPGWCAWQVVYVFPADES